MIQILLLKLIANVYLQRFLHFRSELIAVHKFLDYSLEIVSLSYFDLGTLP